MKSKFAFCCVLIWLLWAGCTPAPGETNSNLEPMLVTTVTSVEQPSTIVAQSSPSPETTLRPTATATVLADMVTTLNQMHSPSNSYEYISLQELGARDNQYLSYVDWEKDDLALVYAISERPLQAASSREWWRYDLRRREREHVSPPQSVVTVEAKQQLNLCSLEESGSGECEGDLNLFESPFSNRIVFSPASGEDELWIANTDGLDVQKIADFTPTYVDWSSDGRWFVTGRHFPGLPGQNTHYLIAADGTFVKELTQITGHDQFLLNGLFPKFSPKGNKLAYIGSEIYESFEESDYNLYILNLDTMQSQLVNERIGLFQWQTDGQGIYVLDGALFPVNPQETPTERQVALYRLDLNQDPIQEHLLEDGIPYHPQSTWGAWLWAYSPPAQAVAYVGFGSEQELGILLLHPEILEGP